MRLVAPLLEREYEITFDALYQNVSSQVPNVTRERVEQYVKQMVDEGMLAAYEGGVVYRWNTRINTRGTKLSVSHSLDFFLCHIV